MSRFLLCLVSALVLRSTGWAQTSTPNSDLMPVPRSLTKGEGQFRLDQTFRVAVGGGPGERMVPAANRFLKRLAGRTGLFLEKPFLTATDSENNPHLTVRCERPGKTALGEDESYSLIVNAGKITLNAPTELGAMHGLETLLQLLGADANGYFFPAVNINDAPRFAWRGLLIDVGRHFQPVDVIKRNLDGLAAVKMNVLHWHLSEDQGFRVESKTYPKLHELGSDGQYYTQEEIRDILRYADQRGIRVLPEFDMPGHATSWLIGYPELASRDSTYGIQRAWGIYKPTMDPTKETTYQFLEVFLKEMAALFSDEYFHIGGDENEGSQWTTNPRIREFMRVNQLADNHALQNYFNQRVLKILTKEGKKMMGWDEIFTPGAPKDLVIHSWRGKQSLVDAARQGYQVVLSNGYYIDLNYSAATHYLNDPIPANSPLDAQAQARVLGGEAAMWSEFVDADVMDSRIWPRSAAIAERLWSPREVNDVDDMYRRLAVISPQLEELGLTHLKNVEMLLRRMTRGADTQPLRALVEVVEPVKQYTRGSQGLKYTQFSPLTRVVDAAQSDSDRGREFTKAVEAFLEAQIRRSVKASTGKKEAQAAASSDGTAAALRLENQLKGWQENHQKLKLLIDQSPVLGEVTTLSTDLSAIAGIGLEALAYIRSGQVAPSDWLEPRRKQLEAAKKPRGQATLVIVDPITKLANWASVRK